MWQTKTEEEKSLWVINTLFHAEHSSFTEYLNGQWIDAEI